MRDHYAILGLEKGASKEKIKATYRRLAMQWHPDKNSSPGAKQKFIEITEAYDELMSGKTISFKNVFQTAKTKPKPKTSEELRRERAHQHYDQLRQRFLDLQRKYNDPRYVEQKKSELYGSSNRYFALSVIIFAGCLAYPFMMGRPAMLAISFPVGLGFAGRFFYIAGRKKMRADMLFSTEENYSIAELRDFFEEDSAFNISME
jgi:curved DNA-binding protein CbpA